MADGLDLATKLGLAYRCLASPLRQNLYIWPIQPTTTDPAFWSARGSHIHYVFDYSSTGNLFLERSIMTMRHTDDVAISQPPQGRSLGGAFHFELDGAMGDAKAMVSECFVAAYWFWTNQRRETGAKWRALDEGEKGRYLRDWGFLLDGASRVCGAWFEEDNTKQGI